MVNHIPRSVAIVGAGSRGLGVFERLVAHCLEQPAPLTVHLIDPQPFGAGFHLPGQPDHLLLNTVCAQLSAFADAEMVDGPVPLPGPSLHDWCRRRDLRLADDGYTVRAGEGREIQPNDFLPRRLLSEYLIWAAEEITAAAPENLTLSGTVRRPSTSCPGRRTPRRSSSPTAPGSTPTPCSSPSGTTRSTARGTRSRPPTGHPPLPVARGARQHRTGRTRGRPRHGADRHGRHRHADPRPWWHAHDERARHELSAQRAGAVDRAHQPLRDALAQPPPPPPGTDALRPAGTDHGTSRRDPCAAGGPADRLHRRGAAAHRGRDGTRLLPRPCWPGRRATPRTRGRRSPGAAPRPATRPCATSCVPGSAPPRCPGSCQRTSRTGSGRGTPPTATGSPRRSPPTWPRPAKASV